MNLASLETYVASHVASAEDSIKAEFGKFLDFVRGEEAKIKAEIEHLATHGYVVVPPQPDAPQAPAAAS